MLIGLALATARTIGSRGAAASFTVGERPEPAMARRGATIWQRFSRFPPRRCLVIGCGCYGTNRLSYRCSQRTRLAGWRRCLLADFGTRSYLWTSRRHVLVFFERVRLHRIQKFSSREACGSALPTGSSRETDFWGLDFRTRAHVSPPHEQHFTGTWRRCLLRMNLGLPVLTLMVPAGLISQRMLDERHVKSSSAE